MPVLWGNLRPIGSNFTLTIFQSLGLLLGICAVCAYLNQRFLRWPQVLAMNIMGVVVAATLLVLGEVGLAPTEQIETFFREFDFSNLVLHGILGLLLFAGAMFVDIQQLRRWSNKPNSQHTRGSDVRSGGTVFCHPGMTLARVIPKQVQVDIDEAAADKSAATLPKEQHP